MDYTPRIHKIMLIEVADRTTTRYDITAVVKDQYTVADLIEFIEQAQITLSENEYYLEFEYIVTDQYFKYLVPFDQSVPDKVLFPMYSAEELQEFYTDHVPNGIMISSVNDEYDITDDLHQLAGPKGNFYSDIDDYPGFKLTWVQFLDQVPDHINDSALSVEIMTFHGKTYVFSNDTHITI